MRNRQGGFTAIELMIVVVIVAILAVLAGPSFSDFMDRYRLRGAVDDVVSVISNARSGAVKLDREVRVTYRGSDANWCVGAVSAPPPSGGARAGVATACNCSNDSPACSVADEVVKTAVGKHAGVALSGAATELVFDGQLGLATGSGGALGTSSSTFASPRNKYFLRVDVSPLGQATVCVPSGPAVVGYNAC